MWWLVVRLLRLEIIFFLLRVLLRHALVMGDYSRTVEGDVLSLGEYWESNNSRYG